MTTPTPPKEPDDLLAAQSRRHWDQQMGRDRGDVPASDHKELLARLLRLGVDPTDWRIIGNALRDSARTASAPVDVRGLLAAAIHEASNPVHREVYPSGGEHDYCVGEADAILATPSGQALAAAQPGQAKTIDPDSWTAPGGIRMRAIRDHEGRLVEIRELDAQPVMLRMGEAPQEGVTVEALAKALHHVYWRVECMAADSWKREDDDRGDEVLATAILAALAALREQAGEP